MTLTSRNALQPHVLASWKNPNPSPSLLSSLSPSTGWGRTSTPSDLNHLSTAGFVSSTRLGLGSGSIGIPASFQSRLAGAGAPHSLSLTHTPLSVSLSLSSTRPDRDEPSRSKFERPSRPPPVFAETSQNLGGKISMPSSVAPPTRLRDRPAWVPGPIGRFEREA